MSECNSMNDEGLSINFTIVVICFQFNDEILFRSGVFIAISSDCAICQYGGDTSDCQTLV